MPERVRPMAKSSSDSPTSMMKMTSAATRNHDDGSVAAPSDPQGGHGRQADGQVGGDLAAEQPADGARVGREPADQGQQHGQIEIVDRAHGAGHVGEQARPHGQREQQVAAVRIVKETSCGKQFPQARLLETIYYTLRVQRGASRRDRAPSQRARQEIRARPVTADAAQSLLSCSPVILSAAASF